MCKPQALVGGVVLIAAAIMNGCGTVPAPSPGFRVVILGVDGMDPDLVRGWQDQLPHVQQLAQEGVLSDLRTVAPPQCAVAWASLATGQQPENHGVSDSIVRETAGYRPVASYGRMEPPWVPLGLPLRGPRPLPAIQSEPYWKVLDDAGVATVTLRAPLSLPLDSLQHGRIMSGLGLPDLRGTWGTHYYLASDLSSWDLLGTDWAGIQLKLDLEEGKATTEIQGPSQESGSRVAIPADFELNADRSAVTIRLGGQEELVAESSWSDWFRFEFPMAAWSSQTGISRFYVLETFPELRLYLMPIGPDPREPAFAFSSPEGYSAQLAERFGLFKAQGESGENWGLNQERIDEGIFLEDLNREFSFWERALLDELDRGEATVYSAFLEAPDAAAHMLYRMIDQNHPRREERDVERYGDALLQVYRRVDGLVGKVRQRLQPHDLLLVVSDHGFHSWEKDFNINSWLRNEGYLRLRDPAPESSPDWEMLFSEGGSLDAVDWGKTEAYAVGFAGIYLNLAGREAQGIVEPGEDYQDLVEEIRGRLLQYQDPDTGQLVVKSVQIRNRDGQAGGASQGPDLVMGLAGGYRASWRTALGEIPENVLVANLKKWSGDHASSDASETAGTLISNRRSSAEDPAVVDVAPTLYRLLGVSLPSDIDGTGWDLPAP